MTPWLREPEPRRGFAEAVAPGVLRLVCSNPGPFTFHGTNTWIVGEHSLVVIDPGPEDPSHHAALVETIGKRPVRAILVTHGHADHWPGSAALARATGAPVLAFAASGPSHSSEVAGGSGFHPDATLQDGDRIPLERGSLVALHTPGHRFDHLCFAWDEEGIVFTGDHVMGWSSSIVSPPEGDMAAYFASLRRLRGRTDGLWLPGHGPAIETPHAFLDTVIAHREAREAAILDALRHGERTIEAIVARVYAGTPVHLHAAASRSVLAHLLQLVEEGRAHADPAPSEHATYTQA